ncbi:MAG: hypothetical protein ACFCBU_02155, partial [Cyanophyceae cyanobacterium]
MANLEDKREKSPKSVTRAKLLALKVGSQTIGTNPTAISTFFTVFLNRRDSIGPRGVNEDSNDERREKKESKEK